MTAEIIYEGGLRTRAVHTQSGYEIVTDAPTDNHGQGAAFSPTDLVATALGSCMLTLMGIYANNHNLAIEGTRVTIQKVMAADPRRISEVHVRMFIPAGTLTDIERKKLENVALTCPVAKSLHPDINQDVVFEYI
jgi:uncharacterized OsmC-like protein